MLKGFSSSLHLRQYIPASCPAKTCRSICTTAGRTADLLKILSPLDQAFRSDSLAKLYVNSLRKCLRSGNHLMFESVHARLITSGFGSDLLLSNVLLDMYAKTGLMSSCSELFDEMTQRDLFTWSTLISGFVRNGSGLEAYSAFRQMHRTDWKPNHFVISSVLSACSASGVVQLGLLIHGLVIKSGLGFDRFVEVGLVDMYAKCGDLVCALKVFYEIPVKISVAWNAMISGYFLNGLFIQALELCRDMCRAGFVMNSISLRVAAAAASALQNLEHCQNLHVYSIKIGLEDDSFVVAEFVKLLTKLGDVNYIHKLHRRIKRPDVSLCSLLISGYHLHGCREEAINLAEELLNLKLNLNEGALLSILNLCFQKEEGTQIHANFLKSGYSSSASVGNALISMYSKFGDMVNAKIAFDKMEMHDVVSWTAVMAGFVQNLQFAEAVEVFCGLRTRGILLDHHSVVTVVSACTGLQNVAKGIQIHCLALKLGFGFSDFTNASMINMYAKCGYIDNAVRLFSYLSSPHSPILINVMIAGYCRNSQPKKAIDLFWSQYRLGFIPDHFTYSTILGACADMRSMKVGEQIHCCVAKKGFEFSDIIIGNAIITLYVKCECLVSACKFFYNMKHWNAHSYMTLMLGYIENGGRADSSKFYCQIEQIGFHAKPISFARIASDYAESAAVDLGRQVHASIVKLGLDSDVEVGSALVGMYATSEGTDISEEASDLMSAREDNMQDNMINQCLDYANSERDAKVFGVYKLETLRKGTFVYEHMANHYLNTNATFQMHEKSTHPDVVHSDCQCDLADGSIVDVHVKYSIQDNSLYMLENTFGSSIFSSNSYYHAYAEYMHGRAELHELTKEEKVWDRAIVLVFLDKSQVSFLDKRMDYLKTVKKSFDGGRGWVQCVPD